MPTGPAETVASSPTRADALRRPAHVMRLARIGSFFPTRLSFMPTLVRRMCREGWRFDRPVWNIDPRGFGHSVHHVDVGEGGGYSLVAFCRDLDPEQRSDRVIATAWDATFVLFDGVPDASDIERLSRNVPRQEAGRYSERELVLSRANKSVRLFDHVVERLATGQQPDRTMLRDVGYLMRTTAVYGNGKFGIADRSRIASRPELAGPFQAEMLAVYLIRCFTMDLVEHVAGHRAPDGFVPLDPALKRYLGIGNSTGLGMAPFLLGHPMLINNWIAARETALARVRALPSADAASQSCFREMLARARRHVAEWHTDDVRQGARIEELTDDLATLNAWLGDADAFVGPCPWDRLFHRAEAALCLEAQELLVSLLLEPHGALVDDLTESMGADEGEWLEPAMRLGELAAMLERVYGWALQMDFERREAQQWFWYVSAEKQEPRLGQRYAEPGADLEMPLAIARDVQALLAEVRAAPPTDCVAHLLLRHPDLRHLVRRVQMVARHPYGEIHDNLVGADCLPIDLLRCKLSFFGASKFDPKSDRWTRITMFQGAPLPGDLSRPDAADWCFPCLAELDGTPGGGAR